MSAELLRTFRFRVTLRRCPTGESGDLGTLQVPRTAPSGQQLGDGGFQECSGLEVSMDVREYQEGGRNDGVIQQVGRAKYSPIVLKRGMFHSKGQVNRDLWKWLQGVVSGRRPVERYDGVIEVMSKGDEVVAVWVFDRGLPSRIRGPTLNAQTGEVAIEELHIVHEGLRLEEVS